MTVEGQDPMPPTEIVSDTPVVMSNAPWKRLHSRVIWVDLARTVLSLVPFAAAVWVFGVEPGSGGLWPVVGIAIYGVLGAAIDAWRWVFTRYRISADYVERRTGLVTRQYRSLRRDRIRSVNVDARLRHRVAGLRVVSIGAGQQSSAKEDALALDAVLVEDAEDLRRLLMRDAASGIEAEDFPAEATTTTGAREGAQVFATFQPHWVLYNMFSIWAYVMALGLIWGVYWLAEMFGFDAGAWVADLVDWEALGRGWTVAVAVVAVGLLGVIGMGCNFFLENWDFELARVPSDKGTLLRTRRGLLRTREVNRDDSRLRGIQIGEPLLWRWMGVADTNVITTGLDLWSMSQPTTILPRGPIGVARPVATAVLASEPNLMETPLRAHPKGALRRRLTWATLGSTTIAGLLAWLSWTGALPDGAFWFGVATLPLALGGAVIAYRALGNRIVGDHLLVRSGFLSRTTTALQRSSVSTIAIRESLFQRRLGLKTVAAMTAAGWGVYRSIDMQGDDALQFAVDAAPGLLDPFLDRERI